MKSPSQPGFRHLPAVITLLALLFAPSAPLYGATKASPFKISTQKKVSAGNNGAFETIVAKEQWQPSQTAIIVCDMWDLHHCKNAVSRVKEMAPRMNQLLEEAREAGAFIIHSPSSCTDFYKGHPARLRAQNVPRASNLPKDIGQ